MDAPEHLTGDFATGVTTLVSPAVKLVGDLFGGDGEENEELVSAENCEEPDDAKAADSEPAGRGVPVRVLTEGSGSNQGTPLELNAVKGHRFENEFFRGEILFLHRLAGWKETDGEPYYDHFKNRQRQYEFRMQGNFKVDAEKVFISGEVRQPLDISWTFALTLQALMSFALAVARARGASIAFNLETVQDNDRNVWPYMSSPLMAANALVRTPAGESPPAITEALAETPRDEKLEIVQALNTQDTFTIAFWEQYVNLEHWVVCNLPFGWRPSITSVIGEQTIVFTIYSVREDVADAVLNKGEVYDEADKHYCVRLFVEPPGCELGYEQHPRRPRMYAQCLPCRCLRRLGLMCSPKNSKR
mmetsp:Transcript_73702/g.134796  ORF Transcript_73702/g.134796 Transcript_73702/m.134796 type:complete len:360 (-) Transcript_73702:84-1163(-)